MTELPQDVLCPSCVTGRLTIDIIKRKQMLAKYDLCVTAVTIARNQWLYQD